MALTHKVQRRQKAEAHNPRFGPEIQPGELFVRCKSLEPKVKKKTKKEIEKEEMDKYLAGWREFHQHYQESGIKPEDLPF